MNRALLPAGLRDVLPGKAAYEAAVVQSLLGAFSGFGFDRVKPPLLEFEDSLLAGAGADLAAQTFRVMDPVTQRMMGMRADMTVQVARIAATRLSREPRPLRLAYAGDVLRVKGSQLRPDRQFIQAGLELIGCDTPEADAEVIFIAAHALARIGVPEGCVELTLPPLVPLMLETAGLSDDEKSRAREARTQDARLVAALPASVAPVWDGFWRSAARSNRVSVAGRNRLAARPRRLARPSGGGGGALKMLAPGLSLSQDAVENRG